LADGLPVLTYWTHWQLWLMCGYFDGFDGKVKYNIILAEKKKVQNN